jgi:hypothetical protein
MVKLFRLLLGLVLLAGLVWLLGWLAFIVGAWFLSLPPETMTPVAALLGVILVPIITFFTSRALERRRGLENAIRESKTKLYDSMIAGLLGMMNLGNGKPKTDREMMSFFAETTPQLITYGSRGVIRAWNDFRKVSREKPGDAVALMLSFEGMLKAMRSDLGHSVRGHAQGELLAIFVNDIGDVLKKKAGKDAQ